MKINMLIGLALLIFSHNNCYADKKEDVTFRSGSLNLSGTILLPKGDGPFPAIVFLHGSGESTRDENVWRAKKFVKRGYIAFIYDKRGAGESEGSKEDWQFFNFDSLAQDAIAATEYLISRQDVDKEKVGLLVASQSGWVAPLAASKSQNISFFIAISASVSTVAEDRLFERAARLTKEGFQPSEVDEATEMQKLDQEVTRNPSRHQEFEKLWEANKDKAWFSRVYISEYFLQDPKTNPYRNWYQTIIDFDPVPLLQQLDIPVLWLFGDASLDRFGPVNKSVERIKELKAQGKNYQAFQYQEADHNLKGADYFADIFSWMQKQGL